MIRTTATTFADTGDLLAYNRAVLSGKSPHDALNVGDNGLGFWGLSTVRGTGPCVALWRDAVFARTGSSLRQPKGLVRVFFGDRHVDCQVRDLSPEGIVDLNPDACEALNITPPWKGLVDWIWL